jgi:D-alanine---(R)-lactate ligase
VTRPRIAVLSGGTSEEHGVSLKSAAEIAAAIDTARWDPVFVRIGLDGAWRLDDGRAAVLSPDRATHGLLVRDGAGGVEELRIDAVLPVLHGRTGEDGAIQGLLELAGIPYVGCDIPGSAICMDKSLAYLVARSAGIPTPDFTIVDPGATVDAAAQGYPVFVKPARSGSSFGVRRVDAPDGLADAIADARRYDHKVLIEQAITGSEVGCAVLGDAPDLVVGEVDQITLAHGFFRIHQEASPETGSENSAITVPADLSVVTRGRIQDMARRIYTALGCRGLARVDMFLQPDGRLVLNEVNTLPGFTSYSRYPRMMRAAGIGLTEIIDRSLELALAR